jgi:hypothetical protein
MYFDVIDMGSLVDRDRRARSVVDHAESVMAVVDFRIVRDQLMNGLLRYAHLAPEKLSSVAGGIERQAFTIARDALRGENVAKNATLALRSMH